MAHLELRHGIYRIAFRLHGRRFRRSLQTRDRRSANAHLARLADSLHRVTLGTLALPDDVDVVDFLLGGGNSKMPSQQPSCLRTLGQLCSQAMASIPAGTLEDSTLQGMQIHIRHLRRHLGSSTPLSAIGLTELQDYVNRRAKKEGRRGRRVQPATIKKELVTLRGLWNWAVRADLLSKPFTRLRDLRFPKSVEKPPFQTLSEIQAKIARGNLPERAQDDLWDSLFLTCPESDELLEHVQRTARHPFILPMFLFAAHTGSRRSEMIRSKIDDIDFNAGTITIREKKRVRGTLTTRSVPMTDRLRAVLESWFAVHPGGDHTFCLGSELPRSKKRRNSFDALTPSDAHHHFKITLANSKWAKLRGWHVFRHSFCSNAAAAGIDQRTINSWVGHQTEEMVRRYRHLIPGHQKEDIRKVFG